MAIVLQGPPAGFDPRATGAFNEVPASPGVYIVGVKIQVVGLGDNNTNKFCPLYVGEAGNLQDRLKNDHWRYGGGYLNTCKELFDLKQNINEIYHDIAVWNTNWANRRNKELLKVPLFNLISKKNKRTLIWFNCKEFFNDYFGIADSNYEERYMGHEGSIRYDLPSIASIHPEIAASVTGLINDISATKRIIFENFFYAFCEEASWRNQYAGRTKTNIEGATKAALSLKNIYTYSEGSSYRGINIDFSNIQNDLVNLTGTPFETPLIISV